MIINHFNSPLEPGFFFIFIIFLQLDAVIRRLRHMPALIHSAEVSYFDFLHRVSAEETSLREKGLWDVPHPWLNMFVPKRGLERFKDLLVETIALDFQGPLLIYPILRDK